MQRHLARVYASLALTVVAAAAGSYLHVLTHVGGGLTALVGVGLMLWLAADSDKQNYPKRLAILGGFGLMKGLSIGGLVHALVQEDPSLLVLAFLGTVVVFASFSVGAMLSARRSLLYLRATLSSALSLLLLLSLVHLFFPSDLVVSTSLYAGLLMFVGYVAVDTQLIIERAGSGDADYVWHALELFIDFVGIFVRIAVILLRKERKERK